MKKTQKIIWAISAFAATAAIFLCYAAFETFWLQFVPTTVVDENIPAEFSGKKIVFIADIHCGEGFPLDRLDGLVQKINSLAPDIVVLGGDYVSRNGNDTNACFEKMAKISAPLGKFGVLGNHDIQAGKSSVLKAMNTAGITPLVNENRRVDIGGAAIAIAGTDETWYGVPDGAKAMQNAAEFTVYLTHDPSYLEKYKNTNARLLLAGHTHGGQITLFGIPFAGLVHGNNYKYEKGIFEESDRTVIVTNGIGTGIVPLRFFARPQINIITLER